MPTRRDDAGELVEERDHVGERDEIERFVLVRESRSVSDLETDPRLLTGRNPSACACDHLLRQVGADDVRVWETPCDRERRTAGSRAEVEHTHRFGLNPLERRHVRRERIGGAHLVPHGRKSVELLAHERTKDAPQPRPPHDDVRHEPSELASDCLSGEHQGTSRWMRTASPSRAANNSAALPPLIAIAMFRYASS